MHSTHFIYCHMASDIWHRTTQIAREETCCRHMGYSFRLCMCVCGAGGGGRLNYFRAHIHRRFRHAHHEIRYPGLGSQGRGSFRLAARVLLYASSHIQDSTHHGLCDTSRVALAGTRTSSVGYRSDDLSRHERTLLPRSCISLW